jgi:hypothetical protein
LFAAKEGFTELESSCIQNKECWASIQELLKSGKALTMLDKGVSKITMNKIIAKIAMEATVNHEHCG